MLIKVLRIFILTLFMLSFFNTANADDTQILINIPSRTLEVWQDAKVIKTYSVGVGRPNFPTPIGSFKVISKILNPGWENPYKPAGVMRVSPGKGNPLGTRWIGFYRNGRGEFGIHGTDSPKSVGKLSSHGCVRMYVSSAEDLFKRVDYDTPVYVRYYPYKLKLVNDRLIVQKFPDVYNKKKYSIAGIINEQLKMFDDEYVVDDTKISKLGTLKIGGSSQIGYIIPPDLGEVQEDEEDSFELNAEE